MSGGTIRFKKGLRPETDSVRVIMEDGRNLQTCYNEIKNSGVSSPKSYTDYLVGLRADQMLNISYKTKGTILGQNGNSVNVGLKKGFVYSDCYEYDKYIGFDVSFRTYMTAINNPYSVMYTENIRRNISQYGINYVSGVDTNTGGFYGIVCNTFVDYAIGQEYPNGVGTFPYLSSIGEFDEITNKRAQLGKVGDVLWTSRHVQLLKDIEYDIHGKVINLYVAESVGNFPITHKFNESEYETHVKNRRIFRLKRLNERIDYKSSEFVSVGDEEPITQYAYNNDICCYLGDYACMNEGFPIFINYNLVSIGNWTSLELYKNDVFVKNFNISQSEHTIDLTNENLT